MKPAGSERWVTTRRAGVPCYGCGKMASCTISPDSSACKCWRDGGAIHRRSGPRRSDSVTARPPEPVVVPALTAEWVTRLCRKYQGQMKESDLIEVSLQLGVTPASLRQLGIGWDGSAWTFPMSDGNGTPVGLHRRLPDGRKRCLKGSRLGLFYPSVAGAGNGNKSPQDAGIGGYVTTGVPAGGGYVTTGVPAGGGSVTTDTTLVVCEGCSDTAAALTLGYGAAGLPSAGTGADMLVALVRRTRPGRMVIVADLDEGSSASNGAVTWPGIEGGLKLVERLMVIHAAVQFCLPPPGVKDLRQWVGQEEPAAVRAAIEASPRVTPCWMNQALQTVLENRRARSQPSWSRRAATLLSEIDNGQVRADLREQFEERAGILEYDANLPPDEAERLAFEEMARKAVQP